MLTGAAVTSGPFVPDDFGPMFCWMNDAATAAIDLAYRPVDMMAHQQWWDGLGRDPTRVVMAVRKVGAPALIGWVQVAGINSVHRSAELGIRIGNESDRNRGYGQEALRLTLDFCWRHLNLNRVHLTVLHHNARAIRAYKAAGFRQEGRLRKVAFIDGAWADVAVMAALRPAQSARAAASGGAASRHGTTSSDSRTDAPSSTRIALVR